VKPGQDGDLSITDFITLLITSEG